MLSCCANYEAYFGGGTKLTVLDPNIPVTPPTVRLLPPSSKQCKKTIVCTLTEFYPDHVEVSWEMNGNKMTSGVATDERAQRVGERFYRLTSRLRVDRDLWEDSKNIFTCTAKFFYAQDDYRHITQTINGQEPEVTTFSRETYMRQSQTGRLTFGILLVKSSMFGLLLMVLLRMQSAQSLVAKQR